MANWLDTWRVIGTMEAQGGHPLGLPTPIHERRGCSPTLPERHRAADPGVSAEGSPDPPWTAGSVHEVALDYLPL